MQQYILYFNCLPLTRNRAKSTNFCFIVSDANELKTIYNEKLCTFKLIYGS